jgi:hypothetical protein
VIVTFTLWPCCAEFGFTKLTEAAGSTVNVAELLLEKPSVVSDREAV